MANTLVEIEEDVLYRLIESNYLLGLAEYKKNVKYNNEHFHYKAEIGVMNYLRDNNIKLFDKFMGKL